MKKKFTILITAAFMLLTMMAQPGRAVGQTTADVTLSSGSFNNNVITWTCADGNITIQQLKGGTSTTNPNSSYIASPRVYKQHILSFVATNGYTITKIDIKYNGSYYGITKYAGTEISDNNVSNNTSALTPTWSTSAGGTHSIATVSNDGLSEIYIQNGHSSDSGSDQLRPTKLTITYKVSGSVTATTVTIDDTGLTNTDVYTSTVAGSFSASVTETESGDAVDGATVAWSSSNTSVATIASDGTVTLAAVGTTTITASYAGESGVYGSSSASYELTVTSSEPYVQPTTIEITPNYTFWGKTGQFSGNDYSELEGSKDNVNLHWTKGSGSTYANTTAMRFYKDNTLEFTAPDGYVITSIVLTVSGTYSDLTFDPAGYDNTTTTWTGSSATVTMSRPSDASSYATISKFTITLAEAGDAVATTTTINVPANFNTDIHTSTTAGTLTATVTPEGGSALENPAITWSSSNTEVATIDQNGAVTLVAVGTTNITASFAGVEDEYQPSSATYQLTVIDSYAPGSVNNPYTVAQAIANTPSSGNVYIQGVVSSFYNTSIVGDGTNYRYYISDDGSTTTQLLVYKGKGLNQATFTSADDLLVGDEVVIYGSLITYQNAPEVAANNYIVSLVRPVQDVATPTFSVAAGTYASAQEVEISCETDGATIYYTLNGTEPTDASTLYNGALSIETTTTVKAIAYKNTANSYVATATYHICSAETPYTVAQALAFNEYPTSTIWVHGIVSTAPTTAPSSGQLKYYISDNGEATNELYIYNGKGLNNNAFTAQDDIQVGDIVTITGVVKDYQGTLEFDSGNYLTSFERPTVATPTFTPGEGEYTAAQSVTIACATGDATIYYKTAENAEWVIYSDPINVAETTTIWAYAANGGMNNSAVATATYTINIPVITPSITVNPTLVEATAEGGDGTLTVTYENITEVEAEVYFCDENGDAATYGDWIQAEIDDNNNVYYIIGANDGEARTAYFKVYALDDDDEDVYSNLVTVTQAGYVPPVVADDYELFSGNLEEGDYIIYYDGYALKNEELNTTGRLSYEVVAPENDVITTADATIVWHIAPSSEYWTIYSADANAYAAGTGVKNKAQMLEDGTDDKAMWTVSGIETYEFINKANSAANVNCNLRNNGTNGWACYATSTGGALSLYKKVDNTPAITIASPVEITADAHNNETIDVTYKNVDFEKTISIAFYTSDGETAATYEWITANINNDHNVVYTTGANTGDARSAYFKVIGKTSENADVISNLVTITQAAYVAPVASITVDPALVEVTAEGGDGTLTVTYDNITEILAQVYFCDVNGVAATYDWITAEINNENNVEYLIVENEGEARTAYFKVYALDDDAEDVYSNLVTVTQAGYVPPVVADDYELFSGDLEEGDYIIYYNGYAMKNTVSSNRLTYETVTPSENVISTNDATIVWHIAPSGNYWTIYSADANAYAASTGTKNQAQMLDDGTDDKALWTASGTSTYEFVNKYNDEQSVNKNLRNNGTNGFACYSSQTGGPLSLYKKVDNTPSITLSSNEINVTAEGANGSLNVTYKNIETELGASIYWYEEDGVTTATTPAWIVAEINETTLNVDYIIEENDGEARATYFKVCGADSESNLVYSELVTVSQAAPIPTFIVSFIVGEDGLFVPNEDFDDDMVEVEAGTYTLPSATKVGYSFSGWSDGDQTYAAGESYTVSDNVEFTATYTELLHFTIQFYVNNNHEQEDDMDAIQDTPILLPLTLTNTSTPDGFEIIGWSAVPSSTVAVPNPYTPKDDVVLYAILNYLYSEDSYESVTDASDLHEGDIVVIAALNSDYAISTTQNANNRSQAAIAKSGNKIALSDGVCEFVLGNGSVENSWSFYDTVNNGDNKGYIYAANSSNNWLRTESELTANSSWTISINENTATITAQGSNTHNVLQYNSSNRIFSCYTSTTQQPVCLYKKNAAPSFNYVNTITDQEAQMDDDIPETTCVVVADNVVLTFNGENNGTAANLIIEDGAQLIHNNEGVQATVRKNIKGFGDNTAGNYYFLVSPLVETINPAIVTNMTPNGEGEDFDLYEWNSGEDEEWRNYKVTPFSLVNTTGYLYANKNNVTLNFEGTLLKSDAVVEIELNYEEGDDFGNWNLVGNPFTCNANVSLIDNGAATSMAYYRMNSDGTEFESSTDPITPMEGIFVQTTGTEQKCRFSRIDPEQSAGKGNLNLQVAQVTNSRDAQPATDNAIIRFDGGNALQKFSFRNDNAKLYIPQNGKDYAVVNAEAQGEMPVYFKAAENGTYTIDFSMDNVEFSYLHLIDNKTGMDIDLLDTPSYTFEANRIDYASRFRLVFRAIGNENDSENNDFGFFDANGNFLILGIEGTATLQVMDVTGRTISSETFSGDYSKAINASAGVYMLRLVQGNDVRTQKIVVK